MNLFTVEQLRLMQKALMEREDKNKERLNNIYFDSKELINEIELSELTRITLVDLVVKLSLESK